MWSKAEIFVLKFFARTSLGTCASHSVSYVDTHIDLAVCAGAYHGQGVGQRVQAKIKVDSHQER